jgi:hypothetical protein
MGPFAHFRRISLSKRFPKLSNSRSRLRDILSAKLGKHSGISRGCLPQTLEDLPRYDHLSHWILVATPLKFLLFPIGNTSARWRQGGNSHSGNDFRMKCWKVDYFRG